MPDAFHARFPVSGHFFRLGRNLLLIKRSEMDPNVEATGVETFDQANYNSTQEYNVALITLLT